MKTHKHGAFDFNQCEECDRERAMKEREYQNPMNQDQQPIATPRMTALKESFGENGNTDFECYDKLFEAGCTLERELVQKEQASREYIAVTDPLLACCNPSDEIPNCGKCRICLLNEVQSLQSERDKLQQLCVAHDLNRVQAVSQKEFAEERRDWFETELIKVREERDKLREALKKASDWARALRYSLDRDVPLPSAEKLTEFITEAEALNHSKSTTQ